MRKNAYAVGERSLTGNIARLLCAGEIHLDHADVRSLYSAGEIHATASAIHKAKCAGEIHATNCSFGIVNAAGDVTLLGECTADQLLFIGSLSVFDFECTVLRNFTKSNKNSSSSVLRICVEQHLKATTFENCAPLFTIDFQADFQNIINAGSLLAPAGIECDHFYSFAPVTTPSINADVVYLFPSAQSKLCDITGSSITISTTFRANPSFLAIPKSLSLPEYQGLALELQQSPPSLLKLDQIAGDTISLDHTNAALVSGIDVTIGDLCSIDRVEYAGSISISPKAAVGELIKLS